MDNSRGAVVNADCGGFLFVGVEETVDGGCVVEALLVAVVCEEVGGLINSVRRKYIGKVRWRTCKIRHLSGRK